MEHGELRTSFNNSRNYKIQIIAKDEKNSILSASSMYATNMTKKMINKLCSDTVGISSAFVLFK